ncbi:MAG: XRE family transcriptional regulator [Gemmatimonadales bacterium]|nr:MAG: XRE family transcriptional regulator [Gemmatimonadales bacterium]
MEAVLMDKSIVSMADPEILEELGARLAALRKSVGLSQEEAAARAALDRSTVSRAERGDNPTTLTVVRLLRVYRRLGALDAFIPEAEVSPMELLRSRTQSPGG